MSPSRPSGDWSTPTGRCSISSSSWCCSRTGSPSATASGRCEISRAITAAVDGPRGDDDPEQHRLALTDVAPALDPVTVGDEDLARSHGGRSGGDLNLDEPSRDRDDSGALSVIARPGGLARVQVHEVHAQRRVDVTEQGDHALETALRVLGAAPDRIDLRILAVKQVMDREAERGAQPREGGQREP